MDDPSERGRDDGRHKGLVSSPWSAKAQDSPPRQCSNSEDEPQESSGNPQFGEELKRLTVRLRHAQRVGTVLIEVVLEVLGTDAVQWIRPKSRERDLPYGDPLVETGLDDTSGAGLADALVG